jgi:hypothetical protein
MAKQLHKVAKISTSDTFKLVPGSLVAYNDHMTFGRNELIFIVCRGDSVDEKDWCVIRVRPNPRKGADIEIAYMPSWWFTVHSCVIVMQHI